jgi:hypothetical protein
MGLCLVSVLGFSACLYVLVGMCLLHVLLFFLERH